MVATISGAFFCGCIDGVHISLRFQRVIRDWFGRENERMEVFRCAAMWARKERALLGEEPREA